MTPDELRSLRAVLDLTQAELGRLVDVDGETVAQWERGTAQPSPTHRQFLVRLARMATSELALVSIEAD